MNLGIIYNIELNKPECVIVHDYKTSNIGYLTYNDQLSNNIDVILNNDIYIKSILNGFINSTICDKTSSYYLNAFNDYLPLPYKIIWIKKVTDNIENILEQAQQLLSKKVYEKDEILN